MVKIPIMPLCYHSFSPLSWPCLQGCLNDAPLLAVSSGLLSPSLLSIYLSLSSPPLPPQLLLLLLLLLLLRHHRHRTPSFPSYSSVAPALGAGASFSMLLLPPTPSPGLEVMFVPVCALVSAPLMNGVRGARRRPVPARPPPPRRAAGRPVVTSRGVSCELPLKCPWGLRR